MNSMNTFVYVDRKRWERKRRREVQQTNDPIPFGAWVVALDSVGTRLPLQVPTDGEEETL